MRRTLFDRLRRMGLALAVLAMQGFALQTALAGTLIGLSFAPSGDGAGFMCRGDAAKGEIGRARPEAGHGCQCPALCPHHASPLVGPSWHLGQLAVPFQADASLARGHTPILGIDIASRDGPARAPPAIGPTQAELG